MHVEVKLLVMQRLEPKDKMNSMGQVQSGRALKWRSHFSKQPQQRPFSWWIVHFLGDSNDKLLVQNRTLVPWNAS